MFIPYLDLIICLALGMRESIVVQFPGFCVGLGLERGFCPQRTRRGWRRLLLSEAGGRRRHSRLTKKILRIFSNLEPWRQMIFRT
jgi:hypothetical protein